MDMKWHNASTDPPQPGKRVIASHLTEFSGEAYVDEHGNWYRLYGAKWNSVFNADHPVTHWTDIPLPDLTTTTEEATSSE